MDYYCSDRFIQTVSEYCTCLKEMPALAQDILRKLYELLRLFNNQVRLGRGATKGRTTQTFYHCPLCFLDVAPSRPLT